MKAAVGIAVLALLYGFPGKGGMLAMQRRIEGDAAMRMRIAGLAIGLVLGAGAALSQDLVSYGEAGGWAIAVDPTLGNGCLMTSDFDDGSTVRIEFDRNAGRGYVATFNANWGDIEDGVEYPVSFMLDDQQYDGTAVGLHLDEMPGALISFDSADFLVDLATRSVLSLLNEGGEVMAIDLAGSHAAIEMTIACLDEQG
jgi:hypothetical protein